MPEVHQTIQRWEAISGAAVPGLNTIEFDAPKVAYERKSDGGWLYLEGFTVTLDKQTYDAHITITKPTLKDKHSDRWNLCHFTVTRANDNHVFYEVDNDGRFRLTTNLLNYEGKNTNGKDHYKKSSQINDPALAKALEHDLRLIFQYLA